MTDDANEPDLDDDFFAENYQPGLAFGVIAAAQVKEKHELAVRLVTDCCAAHASYTNPVAVSGRKSAALLVAQLATEAAQAARVADEAVATAGDDGDYQPAVQEALRSLERATRICGQLEPVIRAIAATDVAPMPLLEAPLPSVHSWAAVAARTERDVLDWTLRVRGQQGRLMILKPSPGTGKTRAQIAVALQEQHNRQRVILAARTKQVIEEELEPRVRAQNPYVRLHVINGRDENTCLKWDNVSAVQEHGYAPGRAVCFDCEHSPKIAPHIQMPVCPYYDSRIRAQNDSQLARSGMHDYPLILTTHAGLISAFATGGGMFGKFWAADLILIDEDPTAALEPTVTVAAKHCEFVSADPLYQPQMFMAKILGEAIELAKMERSASESRRFKDANGERNEIHRRDESLYAGRALHDLLKRVATGHVGQGLGIKSLKQLLRDTADSVSAIHPGSLSGATTTEEINKLVPHGGLGRIAELTFTELMLVDRIRTELYRAVHEREIDPSTPRDMVDSVLDASVEVPDTVYQVRLEWNDGWWRFIVQDFAKLNDHTANIIIGDAYAHVEHYRQMFAKPVPTPPEVDAVTVVEHIAQFYPGSIVVRIKTRCNKSFLDNAGWQEHVPLIVDMLKPLEGKRVLVYGHLALRDKFEELMDGHNDFGVSEWAYEHWWGGRGKDQYRDFDAVVCISEPIQNVSGMLHVVNARALRDLTRHASKLNAVIDGTRITSTLSGKHSLAHGMRNQRTHWRVQQEHERQNINELQQAVHRVRPSMSEKLMIIAGKETELSRDMLAGTVTMTPRGRVSKERGTLRDFDTDGWTTSDEVYELMRAVEEWYGVWSPSFYHALQSVTVASLVGDERAAVLHYSILKATAVSSGVSQTLPSDYQHLQEKTTTFPADLSEVLLSVAKKTSRLQLVERIVAPPPYWELANDRIAKSWRVREAVARFKSERVFRTESRLRPVWFPSHSKSHGYTFYSTRPLGEATRAFGEIINKQYGPTNRSVVIAPNALPFVPF